jgi:hypothetical protein
MNLPDNYPCIHDLREWITEAVQEGGKGASKWKIEIITSDLQKWDILSVYADPENKRICFDIQPEGVEEDPETALQKWQEAYDKKLEDAGLL